jgi:hypothetical protein
MSIDKEVADELQSLKTVPGPQLNWWQRTALIATANAVGVLIGGGLLGFCGIVWSKANSTDTITQQLATHVETANVTRQEMLKEIALLKATIENQRNEATAAVLPPLQTETTPTMPSSEPPLPESAPLPEPTAEQVRAAQEEMQKRLDKAIYRQKQMRE